MQVCGEAAGNGKGVAVRAKCLCDGEEEVEDIRHACGVTPWAVVWNVSVLVLEGVVM